MPLKFPFPHHRLLTSKTLPPLHHHHVISQAHPRPFVWMAVEQNAPQQELEHLIYHHGDNVNLAKPGTGETPLELAIKHGCNANTIKLLLHAGARVNKRVDCDGSSLLHLAAERCSDSKVIKLLMHAGLKPSTRNFRLETPVHVAARVNSNPKVLEALLSHEPGDNIMFKVDEGGKTPLEEAALGGNPNPDISKVLVKKGGDYALASYDWSPIFPQTKFQWGKQAF